MLILVVLVVLLLGAVLLLLAMQYLQIRSSRRDVERAVITEKLSQLEPVSQAVSGIRQDLAELQAYTKAYNRARQDLERRTADSVRRLEMVIAGTQTKGVAGENILETVFANLPQEWQVRNFRVGDKAVEFGLRLPNNLILPIDSKWPATHLLEQFTASEDPEEQRKLKALIERAVLDKAKEVRKYIDPNMTVNFGIAAVPDAVYDLSTRVQADVFQLNVVVIGYSMFVPYLLLVFQTILKSSQSIDMQRLDAYLRSAEKSLELAQGELEGRFSRAITMLTNSRDELSVLLSKVRSGLTSLQITAARGTAGELPEGRKGGEAGEAPLFDTYPEE